MHGLTERHKKHRISNEPAHGLYLKFSDKATMIAGVIGPLMTIPQISKIYYYRNAAGVSAVSWFAFAILDIPFLLYGLYHKEKPIIITYVLWLLANLTVAVGAVIFRI